MERTVPVDLGQRSYQVRVGAGLLAGLGPAVAAAAGDATSVVVVTDTTVAGLYARAAAESLAAVGHVAVIDFPAGEAHKTLATASQVLDRLFAISPAVDRSTVIVTLGGGVVGDLGGFVAAVALRGLRFFQCPTTLLADVDASVGGKTGVDHPAGKNLIGAFHQPAGVLIDVATLRSLPAAELSNGLAECVKHAVIRDATLLDFLEDHAAEVLACREELMTELVARNVAIKAAVVSADEREAGERAHLNFGHTIGHGLEAFAGYGGLGHGQAVALGMVAACRIAVSRGLMEPDAAERVESLLARLGLPVRRPDLDAQAIWQIMQHDKKTRAGQVRMVLPVMLGAAAMFDDITPQSVRDALEYLGG
jgi:3-dehydroquinate synthase